jgi:ADP-ribose pyrophosphatase YjhB (NUDIX family)
LPRPVAIDRQQSFWIVSLAYLALANGSMPLFLIAAAARGEAKNAINRLALSTSPEPATMAAENTWRNWISGARLPA